MVVVSIIRALFFPSLFWPLVPSPQFPSSFLSRLSPRRSRSPFLATQNDRRRPCPLPTADCLPPAARISSVTTTATVASSCTTAESPHLSDWSSHGDRSRNSSHHSRGKGEGAGVERAPPSSSDGRQHSITIEDLASSRDVIGEIKAEYVGEEKEEEGSDQIPSDLMLHHDLPFDRPIEDVYSGVRTGPVLGMGVCGVVRQVTHKFTGRKYAIKRLDLNKVHTADELHRLREEIYIMCQLDHPNVVKLEEVYEGPTEIFLVGELLSGGELFDVLDEQPDYHYTESECARLVTQLLCSVRYIHSKGIVHRDLKLENFLFDSRKPDATLKMIDFGLSKHFNVRDVQCECVGTPYTVAPEVIRGRYDERCDIWALGVLTFLLLSGEPPFGGCGGPEPIHEIRDNILSGRFDFEPKEIWDDVSVDAKDFIRALLVTDPARRPTAKEVQDLPWLTKWRDGDFDRSQQELTMEGAIQAIKKTRSVDGEGREKKLCVSGNLSLLGEEFEITSSTSIQTIKTVPSLLDMEGAAGGGGEGEDEKEDEMLLRITGSWSTAKAAAAPKKPRE